MIGKLSANFLCLCIVYFTKQIKMCMLNQINYSDWPTVEIHLQKKRRI